MGILKVLLNKGNFCDIIFPFMIPICGTVGEINGYRTPFANCGEYKVVNPLIDGMFGTMKLELPLEVFQLFVIYFICYGM
jgi:hypothetical protein